MGRIYIIVSIYNNEDNEHIEDNEKYEECLVFLCVDFDEDYYING